ncbi:hypothetical protein [Dyella sp. 20L07]|uniref:hypothetical protein n=1 Tax=Dyella sp. 20L07 TaxID=3384240 RepID=UPI003D2C4BC7
MEQGKDEQGDIHAAMPEYIVEREEWNGYTLEATYDCRFLLDPRYQVAHLKIGREGGPCYERDVDIHPLRLKGVEIRWALRYVIEIGKSVIEILNMH